MSASFVLYARLFGLLFFALIAHNFCESPVIVFFVKQRERQKLK